ncbi:hypothetical protein [Burkholderia sp. BCC0397]|uniref:immunity protein Imm33 domain-containing protein n=1 Tax=Burkholderia sp. BCC0397 TaxID=486876 RepID=UPI00158ACA24|nr:hypothetical protein [Burkholderia sp. BCC0397]
MNDFGANFKEKYNHANMVVPMEAGLEFGAQAILEYFDGQIKQGVIFKDGETVQFGWSIVILKAIDDGTLEVWEPDFSSMPIAWVRGANNTYRHLMVQKEVCTQMGVDPDYPSLRQAAIVRAGFDGNGTFYMIRESEAASNSGWIIGSKYSADVSGEFRSLFEMAIKCRKIVPFLALPTGAIVKVDKIGVLIELNGIEVSSKSNKHIGKIFSAY